MQQITEKLLIVAGIVFVTVSLSEVFSSSRVFEGTSPYPASAYITDISFDWGTHIRLAPGSDNWPITWADDDHQYTSWGDGGGFGGTNSDGRVSLGVARIEGSWSNYNGYNRWGGKKPEYSAQFSGKSYGIICISNVLYKWVSPLSRSNNYDEARLASSTDHGAHWTQASWAFNESQQLVLPTICQFGRNYSGSRDDYVYSYFIRLQDSSSLKVQKPGMIDLARVHKNNILNQDSYEFFAGFDGNNNPTWTSSTNPNNRVPVFEDPDGVGWNLSVSYNPAISRYILCTEHTESKKSNLGIFDAPEPWGPWTTVAYYTNWGSDHIQTTGFFWNFANKWLSPDGKDFTLVFSGVQNNDSWNSIRGHFTFGQTDDTPPSVPSGLEAHAVSKTQIDLTWNVSSDPDTGVSYYKIYRDGAYIDQANITSFSDMDLIENTNYSYEVSAVNGAGLESDKSSPDSAITYADLMPPTIFVPVTTAGITTVRMEFSEEVEQSSAQKTGNYSINNGITINGAVLEPDLKTVTLTTTEHQAGIYYTLTINNVRDRASNPNTIAPNSQMSYIYTGILEVTNIWVASRKTYQVAQLGEGDTYFTDRSFTISKIPAAYEDLTWIKTANDDKQRTDNPFLTFDVNQDVTVYVGHDTRITTKPSWLLIFTDTGDTISDNSEVSFELYEKYFQAGTVSLGANEGASSTNMYIVLVKGSGGGNPTGPGTYSISTVITEIPLMNF